MDSTELVAEADALVLERFDEADAWRLGGILVDMAKADALAVVINIRTPDRCLFHVAMPGSGPTNDNWARRKSNVAFHFHAASLLVGTRMREKGEDLSKHGLSSQDYASHGGAVPIAVRGVGVVAVATVSGLPQVEDHRLVVRAMRRLLEA